MKLLIPTPAWHRAGTRTAILGIALAWVLSAQGAQRFHPDVEAFNLRVGTQTFAGKYQFTTNSLLVETALAIREMGSDILKFYLGRDLRRQYGIALPPGIDNLTALVRDEPSCRRVLDLPFRQILVWAYCFSPGGDAYWADGMSALERQREYAEFRAFASHLLTTYNGSGKSFYLGHWEGDWYLLPGYATTNNPSPTAIQGMRDWLNTRQQAVDDARRNTPHTNVNLYAYAEVNRVRDAMLNGPDSNQRLVNQVLPAVTNLDFVSWSAYDGQNLDAPELHRTLDYIESQLTTNKTASIPGRRVFIGEYGWGGGYSTTEQEPRTRDFIRNALDWGVRFVLFWQMYNNEPGRSYCLIDPNGQPTPCYHLHSRFLNQARSQVAGFHQAKGRLPDQAEFATLTAPLLNQPFPKNPSAGVNPEETPERFRQQLPHTATVNWSQFRGPNGSGVADSFRPPVKVALADAAWKTTLPTGSSSPVLWGNRIFITGVEGNRLLTIGLDATSGDVQWKRLAPETPLERVHHASNPAASTPCADANHVYVYFGSYGLLCYDHDGRERWRQPIPTPQSMYGVATSPILHHDLLILVRDDDADLPDSRLSRSSVIALNRNTGKPVWETPRPYNRGAWTTPMIWNHEKGVDLVVLGNGRAYGYEPATGHERWYVNGFAREPIAVPVAGDGRLYLSVSMQGGRGDAQLDPEPFWTAMLQFDRNGDQRIGRDEINHHFTLPFRPELPIDHPGFGLPLPAEPDTRAKRQHDLFDWRDKNQDGFWSKDEFTADMSVGHGRPNLAAILPGGSGDITESHVAWNLHSGIPEIPSPVFHEGRLYLVRDGGILSCVAADTGKVLYRERLEAPGQYMASPVIAGGHLYLVSARGVITVVKTGNEFKVVHQTDLDAPVAATPALDSNSLYLRTGNALWAFR